jgi:hypothetical protein
MIPNAPRLGDMPKSEPVPESVYHIRLDKATLKKTGAGSQNPGSPMAEAQFTIFGPEEAEEFQGRKLFENLMLTGEGMFKLRQLLEVTGEDENYVLEDTDQLVGRECAAVVQIEPAKKGEDGKRYDARNKIARFMPLEG